MRGSTIRIAGWLAAAGLLGAAILIPSTALATKPAPEHQVAICHATNSDTNPYVRDTVDIASSGYLKAGHSGHTGPVWAANLKSQHVKWGDIIPSYTYGTFKYAGLNWTTAGQAIWNSGCAVTRPSASSSTPVGSASASASATVLLESASAPVSHDPGSSPSGKVEGLTGTAVHTLPPTDAAGASLTGSPSSWLLLVLALGGLVASFLLVTPARMRRR